MSVRQFMLVLVFNYKISLKSFKIRDSDLYISIIVINHATIETVTSSI